MTYGNKFVLRQLDYRLMDAEHISTGSRAGRQLFVVDFGRQITVNNLKLHSCFKSKQCHPRFRLNVFSGVIGAAVPQFRT